MGNYLYKKTQVRENYIIKDEEADYYNMRGKGPFMVDSFGKKYLKPSYQTYNPGYNPMYRFEQRPILRFRGPYSPLSQMEQQLYNDYYPNYTDRRY